MRKFGGDVSVEVSESRSFPNTELYTHVTFSALDEDAAKILEAVWRKYLSAPYDDDSLTVAPWLAYHNGQRDPKANEIELAAQVYHSDAEHSVKLLVEMESAEQRRDTRRSAALGESLDASEVNFSTMAPQGRAKQRAEDVLDHATWFQLTSTLREASKKAALPVTPNCALIGACVANIEPHITCDGWMTPCYLSAHKQFNVLEVPAEQIRTYLLHSRAKFLNVWLAARKSY